MTTWVLSWVMWDLSLEHLILLLRCPGLVSQQPCGIIVPWSGMELASPALQGEFLITGPPGKSWNCPFYFQNPISFMKHLLIQGIWGDTIFSIFKQQNFQQSWANVQFSSVQLSSVAQSCPTLCDPMNRRMPELMFKIYLFTCIYPHCFDGMNFHLYLIIEHHLCECLCSFSHSSKPIQFKEAPFCVMHFSGSYMIIKMN